MKKYLAEVIGTCVLVFVACGTAVLSGVDWVATSLAFGLTIVAMAYSIGNVSGCHINPAVSFAFLLRKQLKPGEFIGYLVSQFIGGLAGAALLGVLLRNFTALGGNEIQKALLPAEGAAPDTWSYIAAFIAEIVLTFVFVIAILGVTDKAHHEGKHAGIVIGLSLTLVHLLGLGFTGTSVNPARSFGPALLQSFAGNSTSLNQVWIWLLAPMVGAAIAAGLYTLLAGKADAEK